MAEMGRYCKAYRVSDLEKYSSWDPNLANLRQPEPEKPDPEGEERTELEDDDILYLQEDLTVTDGIFKDEHIVFTDDSDEWKTFCEEALEFVIPEEVKAVGAEDEPADDDGRDEEEAEDDD